MKIVDNVSLLLGDDLKSEISSGSRLKIAASCFSIFAFEELKDALKNISDFQFIFTSPTFTPEGATDKIRKERREFFIPKLKREKSLYGSERKQPSSPINHNHQCNNLSMPAKVTMHPLACFLAALRLLIWGISKVTLSICSSDQRHRGNRR